MKLLRYGPKGQEKPGLLDGEGKIRSLAGVVEDIAGPVLGPAGLARLREVEIAGLPVVEGTPRLGPCVGGIGKFVCIGLNYADHAAETGRQAPSFPVFFNKQSTCIAGPFDPIVRPRVSTQLDYEGELGFVIGRRCRAVPRDRAAEVIAGYLVVNDVSVRDWQAKAPTMTLGKSWDTHGPIGPWLVTADALDDPHGLALRTWVNGELRQDSNTRQMLVDCFAQVELLSTVCTLEPGDIVTTGTPAGVGVATGRFLAAGDVVRIEIEEIGAIENRVVDEP